VVFGNLTLPATGGWGGEDASDWRHHTAIIQNRVLELDLSEGEHTIRLENVDGNGCNLDYIALVPVD
jgi:hypothetical protein